MMLMMESDAMQILGPGSSVDLYVGCGSPLAGFNQFFDSFMVEKRWRFYPWSNEMCDKTGSFPCVRYIVPDGSLALVTCFMFQESYLKGGHSVG